jgi:hypothetical protein
MIQTMVLPCLTSEYVLANLAIEPKYTNYGSTSSIGPPEWRVQNDNTSNNSPTGILSSTRPPNKISTLTLPNKSHISAFSPKQDLKIVTPNPKVVQQVDDIKANQNGSPQHVSLK